MNFTGGSPDPVATSFGKARGGSGQPSAQSEQYRAGTINSIEHSSRISHEPFRANLARSGELSSSPLVSSRRPAVTQVSRGCGGSDRTSIKLNPGLPSK